MPVRLDDFDGARPAMSATQWRQRLDSGEMMLGLWLASASPTVAELLGGSGADWLIIDAEHTPQTLPGIADQLRALEASPAFTVVRAPSKDPAEIGRLLDVGARGVMVPMIDTADDARAAIAAAGYPPSGTRGVGGGFARATRWSELGDYLGRSGEAHALILQIESVRAVEQIEGILEVEGVEAVFVGPADLAASVGLLGQPRHHTVRELVERVIAAATERGVAVGVNAFDQGDVAHYADRGARLFGVSADVTLLRRGSTATLTALRSELGGHAP
ncbi:MAG: HpcH/HpaI aldolase family protein [Microthrixaceae bacterium]